MNKILKLNGWYCVVDAHGKLLGALLNYSEAQRLARQSKETA